MGPSTGPYLSGFTDSEEHPPLSFRWSRPLAVIAPPLAAEGGAATLTIRYARFLDRPAAARIELADAQGVSFTARPGRFRVESFPVSVPAGPLRLRIRTEDPDASNLGLAIDWLRIDGVRWTLPLSALSPRLLIAGLFLLALASGFGLRGALIAALLLASAEAAWAARDPFALAHVSSKIALPGLALGAAFVPVLRSSPQGRWAMAAFLAGYLLKGAGLFHPSYFYPDVRNHARYIAALKAAEGSLVQRGLEAQVQVRTAYPRTVAGKAYAFPYSPLFFVPFSWLPPRRQWVEESLKHVALAAGAAEVLVVYWLARLVFGPSGGAAAAVLAAFLPPMYSRLLLAMYPTIAGHLLDGLAIVAAALLAPRPASRPRLLAFAASTLAAFLTYIASLFNLTSFAAFLAVLERPLASRLLAMWAAASSLTVAFLYLPFTLTFLGEILPALARGAAPAAGSASDGLVGALARIPLFYGWAYPVLAVSGMALARRRAEKPVYRVLAAYGLAFLLLVALRGLGGGLFKDLKEILFVGPLVAVTAGASLEALATRGRAGRTAALLLASALIAFGIFRYRGYLASHASLIDLG